MEKNNNIHPVKYKKSSSFMSRGGFLSILLLALSMMVACEKDDSDLSAYMEKGAEEGTETPPASTIQIISIEYNGNTVNVNGDNNNFVKANGAHVTVNTASHSDSLLLVLSGSSDNGSLIVYREKKFGIQLNGLSLHNATGAAINNQCKKSLYLHVNEGTTNTMSDGESYTDNGISQKGALFSEGQIYLMGSGTLNVTGNCRHAIASDDYIIVDGNITLNVKSTTGTGIKVNDGLWINSGKIDINVTADAARGIKSDSVVVITGGNTTITTSGDCVYDKEEDDYSSAACIKCDRDFTMSAGTLTMSSSGDGGKCINTSGKVEFSGGTLTATTTGDNEDGKPKAIKAMTGILVSGGSFSAKVSKSWACDSGYGDDTTSDSDRLDHCVTITGNPTTSTITKKNVNISF